MYTTPEMGDVLTSAAAVLLAYLGGAIPFAYLVIRWRKGLDPRVAGTRNVGALNTYRLVGRGWALVVLAGDVAKGAWALGVVRLLGAPEEAVYATGVAVIVGHNWPIYLGFRGGRGAATALGVSIVMVPVFTAITFGVVTLVALGFRSAVPGIFVGFLVLNGLIIGIDRSVGLIALCLVITFIVIGSYFAGQREKIMKSLRSGRWLEILGVE